MKIAVLKGGFSAEREVSLRTGAGVAEALRSLSHVVEEVDVKDPRFPIPEGTEAAFICLHGTFGEDGQVQRILEQRGMKYTGEGVETSRLGMDKLESKKLFLAAGVATPEGGLWDGVSRRPYPFIVKPVADGSSVGLCRVFTDDDFTKAKAEAVRLGKPMMIEQMIEGREVTVGILGDQTLPVIEIRARACGYDYASKYTAGGAEYLCPAPMDADLTRCVQQTAMGAHRAIGGKIYSRVDLILDQSGKPWVLEVNTIPGMTALSHLPNAAGKAGITYPQLCEKILKLSLEARS